MGERKSQKRFEWTQLLQDGRQAPAEEGETDETLHGLDEGRGQWPLDLALEDELRVDHALRSKQFYNHHR